ncbi:glucosyl-3-phosphoglycerate synthase [Embleya sp. MST-111070]|uniref:glucosyl-3-phosphoglycerate synthase n=1 Tax=Embleya sp. MST-111070 TaxID=3398231 RepID=UPI003F731817
MTHEVGDWLRRRSSAAADWPVDRLLDAKRDTRVSVVLPALNEAATVGDIVKVIRTELVERVPLVDELVVVDSGSTDDTARVAADAGARVVHRDDILPALPAVRGKGEVLWRSLLVTDGDIVAFVDADLKDFSADFVTGILGPLLTDPSVQLVKAMYDRPLEIGDTIVPAGGGRVTELVARPLLNLHWPELAGFVQPLGGEYAARRTLLEQLPFPCGYGIETAMLVDTLRLVGLDAMAQVDVGVRRHNHQDEAGLGRMAAEILQAVERRLRRGPAGAHPAEPNTVLTQFERDEAGFRVRTHDIAARERPPMATVPEYRTRTRLVGR